ncbi:MAG TPA: hypothetical protein VJA66_13135 [Thermoanaerobaculia bacterium]
MSKWVSYGYRVSDDLEARQAREIEEELLREHLPLILASSERILETPRFFYCQLADAWLSSMWLYGGGPIPLGVLLLLWEAGEMQFECPSCGGPLYAIGVSGSALSGSGSAWGICAKCRTAQSHRGPCGRSVHAGGRMLPRYRNEPIIQKGKHPRFDWKDGLTGESTPDRVIVPAVEAVDLWELICALTGKETTRHNRGRRPAYIAPRGMSHPIVLERKRT